MVYRLVLISTLFLIAECELEFIAVRLPLLGKRSAPNAVWPEPQRMSLSNDTIFLRPHDPTIFSNLIDCDIIAKAIERYEPLFFPPRLQLNSPTDAQDILQSLTLNVRDNPTCEQYITLDSDESYDLTIFREIAIVNANSVWGLLRGLETFSQLVYINEQNYAVINHVVNITYYPRFRHRGVMLDSARHFLPVPLIKKNLDVMSYNKYNVFHWHLVDDQSFPFQSETFPELSQKGAYSAKHVYTPADVADVLEHARLRGIRVIPEIDTPGHTFSWSKAMPELITVCWNNSQPYQEIYGVQGKMEIFNPSEPRVYTTMDSMLREVKRRFPSNYIHLGMDEVYDKCWLSNPNISAWMVRENITNAAGIHSYYADRILNIMRNINSIPIVWQDVLDEKVALPPGTIVQVWKGADDTWAPYLDNAVKEGYNVILSTPWYLNYISYGKYNTATSVMNLEFFKYYEVEPLMNFTGTEEQKQRILGGEACLWGEFLDSANLLPVFWPRAAAVAERLWSDASVNNPEDAQFRLDVHRCRLLRRGIPAQPILNGYCGDYEPYMEKSMINDPAFNYDNINTTATTVQPTDGPTLPSTDTTPSTSNVLMAWSVGSYFLTVLSIFHYTDCILGFH